MLACAFLPFLPLIEDAIIRQLGDDDFAKREAATRFLSKLLQDTDGFRNLPALLVIKKARANKNPEIRRRIERLYDQNRSRYFLDCPYFCIFIAPDRIAGGL
jgi:hypothetical protein